MIVVHQPDVLGHEWNEGAHMNDVNVIAVVGMCGPERAHYATRLAAVANRTLFSARRLALSPDPIDEALALTPWTDRPEGAVVEFPRATPVTEIIGACATDRSRIGLNDVVYVADAIHLIDDLRRDAHAPTPVQHLDHAVLALSQLEFASMIVLVNWEGLSTRNLAALMALVSHLSPHARLRLDHGALEAPSGRTPYAASQERPGWVTLLNDEHDPHMADPRISSIRYEQLRPFHPGRLAEVLDRLVGDGEFGTVIRSAGFCRLATRAEVISAWDHVGGMITFDPLTVATARADGEDELLSAGQDLAVIGIDLQEDALCNALDSAALTDEEFAAGPAAWNSFPDPFPTSEAAPRGHV